MNLLQMLKDLFLKKAGGGSRTDGSFVFRTEDDLRRRGASPSVKGEREIALLCFRTLAVSRFSLPFGKNGRVRDALRMSYRHLLGDNGSTVMIHQITEQRADKTEGIAWFVSKDEIEGMGGIAGKGTILWPAPLLPASRAGDNGAVIWDSKSGTSGILFHERIPAVYRWIPHSETSADELEKWFLDYCRSQNMDPGHSLRTGPSLSQSEIQKMGNETLRDLKASASLDLSAESADSARRLESFFSSAFYAAGTTVLLGSFFLILSAIMFFYSTLNTDVGQALPSSVYYAAFGERSDNPLASSAVKLRRTGANSSGMTLERTLENLAVAWDTSASPDRIRLDSIRYGSERTEIQGIAVDAAAVGSLRDSLDKNGFTSRISDIRQISGTGTRFTINLESRERDASK